jgi:T-complex protein 1 subunit theta
VDDGVASLKALLKDPRLVPGAGATELALARRVDTYGASLRGLAQHAVRRFASALEVIPRTLAENAHGGAEGNEIVARLLAKHEKDGGESWGVDVEVSRSWNLLPFTLLISFVFLGRNGRHGGCYRVQYR